MWPFDTYRKRHQFIDWDTIVNEVRKQGYIITKEDIKEHEHQGKLKKTFEVQSDKGLLIIGVGGDNIRNERDYLTVQFLKTHKKIPLANIICSGKEKNGNSYIVKIYIDGEKLKDIKDKEKHIKRLAEILAYVHNIETKKYGYSFFRDNFPEGKHRRWLDFLEKELSANLGKLYKLNIVKKDQYNELVSRYKLFFKKYKHIFLDAKSSFLLGDVNFTNILVDKNQMLNLLDFEFSACGDPAYEFACFETDFSEPFFYEYERESLGLNPSFNINEFKFRMKLYRTIKWVLIASTMAQNKRIDIAKYHLGQSVKLLDQLI